MTEAPKTYEIRTVLDLLDVPNERLSDCLSELEMWVHLVNLSRVIPGATGIKGHDAFLWTDDGRAEGRLHIRESEAGPVVTATFSADGLSIKQEPTQ